MTDDNTKTQSSCSPSCSPDPEHRVSRSDGLDLEIVIVRGDTWSRGNPQIEIKRGRYTIPLRQLPTYVVRAADPWKFEEIVPFESWRIDLFDNQEGGLITLAIRRNADAPSTASPDYKEWLMEGTDAMWTAEISATYFIDGLGHSNLFTLNIPLDYDEDDFWPSKWDGMRKALETGIASLGWL
jgi:hypothetical protein